MVNAPYIPRATLEKLAASHPEGTRHQAIIEIAMSLLGSGLSEAAVFAELRSKFPPEKTDSEITGVIHWCHSKNPTPCVPTNGNGSHALPVRLGFNTPAKPKEKPKITKESILTLTAEFLDGDQVDAQKTKLRSPVGIGELQTHGDALLSNLYQPEDRVNVVCDFTLSEKGKANPKGGGKTLTRDEWIAWFLEKGIPSSKAGAWVRPNPCGEGTGLGGAIMDADIVKHRFMLLESDSLHLDAQLALYARFKLPIAVILLSGGNSAHAWVKLDAPTPELYQNWVKRILDCLLPLGFDQSNKNPSRLSRLPGAKRIIGASGNGEQQLLYLNPSVEPFTENTLAEFEKQVSPPFISRHPLAVVAREAVDRYEELFNNRGHTGLHTGITAFDKDSGGLKKGQLIVLAAQTNVGKTSLALNIINHALNEEKAVALFTLEMDREEIFDLLICMNLGISRNAFNTGEFSERDLLLIANGRGRVSRLPLHIFDAPGLTVEDIEATCIKLCESQTLGLIVVDYLQLVLPPVLFKENREQQIAHIGRSLRLIAKKCKVPVIAVSQLNEEGKIRESRAVAHDAHIVFVLEWEDAELKLKVIKGRSIPRKNYPLYFKGELCRMEGGGGKIRDEDVPRRSNQ